MYSQIITTTELQKTPIRIVFTHSIICLLLITCQIEISIVVMNNIIEIQNNVFIVATDNLIIIELLHYIELPQPTKPFRQWRFY